MYVPKKKDLSLFRTMATDAYSSMPSEVRYADGDRVAKDDMAALANLQGAVRLLGSLGALNERWLKKIGARPGSKP